MRTAISAGVSENGSAPRAIQAPPAGRSTTARAAATSAVTNWQPISPPLNFAATPMKDLFACNVFSPSVMKNRLPKEIYKSLMKTIKSGEKLDSSIADVVATAMNDWAIEKGATHYRTSSSR